MRIILIYSVYLSFLDLKHANSVSMTVEESIVCDGFVDMDVSIEGSICLYSS